MPAEPDYSRAALARFIEFVVAKGLVNPSTAQGWRVATGKVLEELTAEELADVRRIDAEATFRAFLHRHPGRLSPASVGEYRRRVGRAIEEFVRWVDDPGAYGSPGSAGARTADAPRSRRGRGRGRTQVAVGQAEPGVNGQRDGGQALQPTSQVRPRDGLALEYPLRPGFLAQVVVPPDLTVDEARRMGAFLLTLSPDYKPA
ncbi:MAG TPA: hypothetical protein VFI77_07300 [Gemmatimonadales bacterium]|jgi:hypothetical protein|nr:hypothetical protein [Gemmatimonadales bacterium]